MFTIFGCSVAGDAELVALREHQLLRSVIGEAMSLLEQVGRDVFTDSDGNGISGCFRESCG